MKVTMKFLRLAAAALAVAAFVSCEENTPETPDSPEEPSTPVTPPEETIYPEKEMTFVVDGVESPVGSAFAFPHEGQITFTASPDNTTLDEVFNGEFIQVLVMPQALNRDINLKEEILEIYTWDDDTETMEITPDMLESGSARMNHEEGTNTYTLLMSLAFTDGTEVGINASAVMEEPAPEEGNTITINGNTQPLRASFYLDDGDGNVYLYFTSAAIEYFGEIDLALDYFCIVLNEDDLTDNEFDITNTNKTFSAFYVNNTPNEEYTLMFDNTELDGATGTINVSRNGSDPEQFTADISVVFGDGTDVSVSFDGTCLSVDYVPEEPVKENEFTCFEATESIKSILVDKSDAETWHIYLTATPGLATVEDFIDDWAFHITVPSEAFDGDSYGFSTYKDILKFEYDGNTWQFSNDDTGTISVTLDGDQLDLDFNANGDEVVGHYSGTAVIVE